jgi:hypothetical protein
MLVYGLLMLTLILAGSVGLSLAFGIRSARLDWDDPRKMTSSTMGCVGTLVCLLYIGVSVLIFIAPPLIASLVGWEQAVGQVAGLLLGGAFSLACTIIPLALVRKKVETIGMV